MIWLPKVQCETCYRVHSWYLDNVVGWMLARHHECKCDSCFTQHEPVQYLEFPDADDQRCPVLTYAEVMQCFRKALDQNLHCTHVPMHGVDDPDPD